MQTSIKLRDDNGRIVGTARVEQDKTLPQVGTDIATAVALLWVAWEAIKLLVLLLL
ncbi:hypothetical protein [Paenibacillus sp. FSL M7-0896]|uniref:hypothetical protein n=1 Tax=Paenibacillus sp. FSL M7-0896 TaxID=2921610 RepID=UPI0030D9A317